MSKPKMIGMVQTYIPNNDRERRNGKVPDRCKICGKAFTKRGKFFQIYCSPECAKTAKRMKAKQRTTTRPKRIEKEGIDNLSKCAKAALDKGMTYGEYMALKKEKGWWYV